MIRVIEGDALAAIPGLVDEGVIVDSIVTDPPYHLTARTSRFGKEGSAPPQHGKDGAMGRLSKGFMGKSWDGGDIAFRPETWATIGTVLRPGGFMLVFGGTRTYHRMTCAIEDAGFVIQDCIMWLYGTGFPKRRDNLKPAFEPLICAQKPFDVSYINDIGSELEQVWEMLWSLLNVNDAVNYLALSPPVHRKAGVLHDSALMSVKGSRATRLVGSSDPMGMFPSLLEIVGSLSTVSSWHDTLVAFSEATSTSVIKTVLNTITDWKILRSCLSEITPESIIQGHKRGRLSNADAGHAVSVFNGELTRLRLILEHSVIDPATSSGLIERLDEIGVKSKPIVVAYKPGGDRTLQVDECRIGTSKNVPASLSAKAPGVCYGKFAPYGETQGVGGHDPNLGRWPANVCHDGSDEVIAAFPNSNGAAAPVKGSELSATGDNGIYGHFNRAESGPIRNDAGSAARFFWSPKAGKKDRAGSKHPTIKPVRLLDWLVPLVTPKGGTVLDPFGGSGTTGVAANNTGRRAILIEREAEYAGDIRRRFRTPAEVLIDEATEILDKWTI